MKKDQLKTGTLLSYFQMALGIIIGLFYTPAITYLLGQSEYGLYNTVSSTISMLSILNFGFNSSYIRFYAKYNSENDMDSIYKLNGMFLSIFMVIGFLALISGLYISFNLDIVFSNGLTEKEYATARILMVLLTINLAVSFPMSIFSNIISANEKFIFLKLVGMIKTVVTPLVTLPLLLAGLKSIAMVSVIVILSFFTDLVYMLYVFLVLKNHLLFHNFEKGLFKNLFVFTLFIAINIIVDQINWNIDKILLGRFRGTVSVAVYSIGYSLYQYYQMFSTSISNVFTPRIHKIVYSTMNNMQEQNKQLTSLFIKTGRIQFMILGLVASGLVFYGYDFIVKFWVGEGYQDSYYVMILLVLSASIALIQNLGIEIQRAENRHQFRSIIYLFMAIVNLMLSVYLCKVLGAIGSAFGTAFSLIVANGLIMNIFYHKKCNINIISFWKSIFKLIKAIIIPVIYGIVSGKIFIIYNISGFILSIIIYTVVYCISMWTIGMNEEEKELIIRLCLKYFKSTSIKGRKND